MVATPLSMQNWNRSFGLAAEGISFMAREAERRVLRGGVLRRVRRVSRYSSGLVALAFSLHCTRPHAEPRSTQLPSVGGDGFLGGSLSEVGEASWYGGDGDGFEGRPTANGETFDPTQLTCAHRTLPLGSFVEVENMENGRKAVLRVNDRGPFIHGRILDASHKGAQVLGFAKKGITKVRLRAVRPDGSPAPIERIQDNPYTIQVAALSEPNNIERLKRELEDLVGPVTLRDTSTPGGKTHTRVLAGRFTRFEDAQKAANDLARKLASRGVEPFVTRRH